MDVFDQVIQLFAGANGLLDDVPIKAVHPFAKALLEHFAGSAAKLREELVTAKGFSDDLKERFLKAMREFKADWMSKNAASA